jgi:hypothetical protein
MRIMQIFSLGNPGYDPDPDHFHDGDRDRGWWGWDDQHRWHHWYWDPDRHYWR